jgi:hypothetical protein
VLGYREKKRLAVVPPSSPSGGTTAKVLCVHAIALGWRRLKRREGGAAMQQGTQAAFRAPSTRALGRHGLRGPVTVTLSGSSLQLTGEAGGVLLIAPERVRRLRTGWEETKYGISHETRLWLVGEAKPLNLQLMERVPHAYAAVIRGFAAEVARVGGLARLECGTTQAGALFLPIAFGLLSIVAIVISLFVITEEPWWGRLIVPVAPIGVFLYGLHAMRRMWPKPAGDLAAFQRAAVHPRYAPSM